MGITGTTPTPIKLSNLQVDIDKDWGGHDITNVRRIEQIAIAYESREAGESVNKYDIVYMDGNLIKKADARNRTKMPAVAMAITSGVLGDPIGCWFHGIVSNAAWSLTSGATLFLMSGGILGHNAPDVSGNVVQSLGRALTQTALHFEPEDTIMVIGH